MPTLARTKHLYLTQLAATVGPMPEEAPMPLSEHEKRVLERIEEELSRADPRLTRIFHACDKRLHGNSRKVQESRRTLKKAIAAILVILAVIAVVVALAMMYKHTTIPTIVPNGHPVGG